MTSTGAHEQLTVDPRETCDLAADRPDEVTVWRSRLVDDLADRPEGFVVDGELVTTPAGAAAMVPGVSGAGA